MGENMSEIDLAPFCSTDPRRPYLHAPSSRGDFTYATNGHILIKIPKRDGIATADKFPDCEKVMPSFAGVSFKPLAHVVLPPRKTVPCDICEGRGHAHDCPDCGCECDECDGRGSLPIIISVDLRGGIFDAHYISILLSLPGIEIPERHTDPNKPMPFRFDGGVGCLMPMKWHVKDRFAAGAA